MKFYHGVFAHERIAEAEWVWIVEGGHLGFWLSLNGAQALDAAREFLHRHRPIGSASPCRQALCRA